MRKQEPIRTYPNPNMRSAEHHYAKHAPHDVGPEYHFSLGCLEDTQNSLLHIHGNGIENKRRDDKYYADGLKVWAGGGVRNGKQSGAHCENTKYNKREKMRMGSKMDNENSTASAKRIRKSNLKEMA